MLQHHTFPKLYKKGSRGQIQEWEICVHSVASKQASYETTYGQQGGQMQSTKVDITEGKNIGKANETSVYEQAYSEAESKWKKQKDKGYCEDIHSLTDAKRYLPMLAKSFKDHGAKIKFPCYVQPKLDGIRCVAYLKGKEVVLLSRKGKPWKVLPHLKDALLPILSSDFALDGELYIHGAHFQNLTSAIKRDEPSPESVKIEYHVYDMFSLNGLVATFETRMKTLRDDLAKAAPCIKLVPTYPLQQNEIQSAFDYFRKQGYEGMMLRNSEGVYENDKRSDNLQKYKEFLDDEFEIIGGKEGKGRFEGMCIFTCRTRDGKEFEVMPEGTEVERRKYWADLKQIVGKKLTVRFFEYSKDGIPRFPIGVTIRDYE